jgi:hypothetical protein
LSVVGPGELRGQLPAGGGLREIEVLVGPTGRVTACARCGAAYQMNDPDGVRRDRAFGQQAFDDPARGDAGAADDDGSPVVGERPINVLVWFVGGDGGETVAVMGAVAL